MEVITYYVSNYINEIILALCVLNVLVLIILLIYAIKFKTWKRKYKNFMNADKEFNIEEVLKNNIKNINTLKELHNEHGKDIKELEKYLQISFQKFAVVKYDAFKEMGGKISFALALLNQQNSGIIINGIHSREGCYIYIKTVENGNCEKVLSQEEKEALQKAMKQI